MGKLFGASARGRSTSMGKGGGGGTPPGVNMLDPSQSGNPDVVQARNAQVTQGAMEQKQLKKNKSKGLTARRGGK